MIRDHLKWYWADPQSDSDLDPEATDVRIPVDHDSEHAVLASSVPLVVSPDSDLHFPLIDLDCEAELIPSSTPGHYHLYIGRAIPAEHYFHMLYAMARAGIVQVGYAEMSRHRGAGFLRLPWRSKDKPVPPPPPGVSA